MNNTKLSPSQLPPTSSAVEAFNMNNPSTFEFATSNNAMNMNMNISNQQQQQQQRKRSHKTASADSSQKIVTGRSFKRLRLDHSANNNNNNTRMSSTQSTGSVSHLSVGTMGADLESNDEIDLGKFGGQNLSLASRLEGVWK